MEIEVLLSFWVHGTILFSALDGGFVDLPMSNEKKGEFAGDIATRQRMVHIWENLNLQQVM